ncbi:MAG: hypothetical protein ABFS09_12300 [Thermodesulfobacteriota bacterium]
MKTFKGLVTALFVVAALFVGTSALAGPVPGGTYWDCETDTFAK